MILTDGHTETPVVDILPEEVDNWHEITDEEAEEIINKEMLENGEN
jgi:hypothetical protein